MRREGKRWEEGTVWSGAKPQPPMIVNRDTFEGELKNAPVALRCSFKQQKTKRHIFMKIS